MAVELKMPALSPTMEEGTLARWLVKEGDTVSAGDVLAEIETDKATMEVEAVDEGKLGKILVKEGAQGVKVNDPIAVLLEEGEVGVLVASGEGGAVGLDSGSDGGGVSGHPGTLPGSVCAQHRIAMAGAHRSRQRSGGPRMRRGPRSQVT